MEHHRTVVAAVVVKYTPQLWLTDGTTTTNTSRTENQNNNKLIHRPSDGGERRSESEHLTFGALFLKLFGFVNKSL